MVKTLNRLNIDLKLYISAAVLFLITSAGLADNAEANKEFQTGLEKIKKGEYAKAAKDFQAAELFADDIAIKANALKQAVKCYQQTDLKYKEFECWEKLINAFPTHINFAQGVDREFDIGDKFFIGETDPAFEWIPWLRDTSKSQEIYEKALKHGPYAKKAPEAKLRLGRLYVDANKTEEAIKAFKEIIKMYPDTIQEKYAYLELANVLVQLSKFGDGDGRYGKEARETLEAFREKYPKDKEISWVKQAQLESNDISANRLYGIAKFYKKLDRTEPAARYLNDILKEYPDADKTDDSEQLLADIDSEYRPPLEKPDKPLKYQVYPHEQLPVEASPIIGVPENSDGKWLLPIRDTGLEYQQKIKPVSYKNVMDPEEDPKKADINDDMEPKVQKPKLQEPMKKDELNKDMEPKTQETSKDN